LFWSGEPGARNRNAARYQIAANFCSPRRAAVLHDKAALQRLVIRDTPRPAEFSRFAGVISGAQANHQQQLSA